MKRREFITLAGSTAIALPLMARAQQPDRIRRIGVLIGIEANDPEVQPRKVAFEQELEKLGWSHRNFQVDYRFAGADPDRMQALAKELIALPAEVIVGHNTRPVAILLQQTRSIPVVFVAVADPIGIGFAASLARPGGNATGFMNHDPAMGGKWLELLKDAAPGISKAALLYNPETAPGAGSYFEKSFNVAARSLAIAITPAMVRSPSDIAKMVASLPSDSGYGLVVMPDTFTTVHREQIVALASEYRLPAIYPWRYFATAGGFIVYRVNQLELFRLAATYVDRILRGERPADLPVQAPTRFELVINLKAAKTLGITVAPTLLARADEVIE
jgi:putative ABC transport system substrate-binding protein